MLPLLVTAGFAHMFLGETLSWLNLSIRLAVVAVVLVIVFNQSNSKSKE
jgi:drug/metabolite transporter (DMT)-like permease